ncbi:MAG TPA: TIGR03435 family protein [Candidatus Limnocylindrales bacterium]|nr:TIGR03435 family protein [Candidatus Limnocylindrales bacterium]
MRLAAAGLLAVSAFAQSFEIASIKPWSGEQYPGTINGGPGSKNPGEIVCIGSTLQDLLLQAYRLPLFQMDAPGWITEDQWNVVARVPAGAARADLMPMYRELLETRFGLRTHRETRELRGYAMSIGKGGRKFEESAPPLPDRSAWPKMGMSKDGFITFPPGYENMMTQPPDAEGIRRLSAGRATMARLAGYLGRFLKAPVEDRTGLSGFFDFHLAYTEQTLVTDVERLGLKMTPARLTADVLVIDALQRKPIEN